MSTKPDIDQAVLYEALRRIDSISRSVPIARTLTELQLVVERVSFSGLHERTDQGLTQTLAEIELFFRDEVSEGMVQFVCWLAEKNILPLVGGKVGRVFLSRCIKDYSKVQEVQVLTAIALDEEHRNRLTEQLRVRFPHPSRIIFNTSATVVAGFVISAGSTVIDRSLRAHTADAMSKSVKNQEFASGGARG